MRDHAIDAGFPEPVRRRFGKVAQARAFGFEFVQLLVELVTQAFGIQGVRLAGHRLDGAPDGDPFKFRDQRPDLARLDQKAVGTELKRQFLVAPVGEGRGIEHEGRALQQRMCAYRTAQAVTVQLGHQDVGHDEVRHLRQRQFQRAPPVGRHAHRMAARLQRGRQHQARILVILCKEYVHSPACASTCSICDMTRSGSIGFSM